MENNGLDMVITIAKEFLRKELGREPTIMEITSEIKNKFEKYKSEVDSYKPNWNVLHKIESIDGNPYEKSLEMMRSMENMAIKKKVYTFGKEGTITCLRHKGILESSKIFRINDEHIIDLLLKTNNNLNVRNIPFPQIFIDHHIVLDDCIIHGILVYNVHSDKNDFFGYEVKNKPEKLNNAFLILGHDKKDKTEFYKLGYIEEKGEFKNDLNNTNTNWEGTEFSLEDLKGLTKKISLFICNFLDFLNNPEVEIVEVERTQEQNAKRIARGKPPIPPINYVRITGKLKLYLDELKSGGHFSYVHKFWVRGHFRTLRSEKWVNKRGTKLWILPFIKGQGILINKIYEVKSESS